jgi:GTP-binding protein HflX
VQDRLFSTLDPTVRQYSLPDRSKVLFIDTVGFIDQLPHNLVEAFKATLEEVAQADILIHVIDISHPKAKEQSDAVYKVLEEIGASGKPVISALNKTDKMPDKSAVERAMVVFPDPVAISAVKREGFDRLTGAIAGRVQVAS